VSAYETKDTAYAAAREVAATVEEYFARHRAEAPELEGEELAPAPDAETIEAVVDAAFWASLRREEGHSPRISLAYLPPDDAAHPLLFERPIPLDPGFLTRLAPAVERPGIHLGVWRRDGELYVWGAVRAIPYLCFVLEVVEPGLLVVKSRRREEFSKYANVAVLHGEQVRVVDESSASLPDCPALLSSLLSFDSSTSWVGSGNMLVQLAVSMRAHGRGGSLLVVPAGSEAWRGSILRPIPYSVAPSFTALAGLMRQDEGARREVAWQEAVLRAVDLVGGLTAVDGATIITDRYELLAFGAKIGRAEGSPPVAQVIATEPVVGNQGVVVPPAQLGATRHLSAAQFVHDQHDALALVASQDGRFTVFAWSPCEGMVHAHRVDTLLL